jgi:hypothetical protein
LKSSPHLEPLSRKAWNLMGEVPGGLRITLGLGPIQGVILELENGDLEGVLYGAVLGRIRYNLSIEVSFAYKDGEGLWKVEI